MAHFVNNPPDKVNLTGITELNLLHSNGTATVCVWGMPGGVPSTVVVQNGNMRFAADLQNVQGQFSYYYVRGLAPGDFIAAAFYVKDARGVYETTPRQHTGWLPVKNVKAYRSNPRPSVQKPEFMLDSYGSEQRHPPIKENDWIAGIEQTLATLKSNAAGRALLDLVPANPANKITIKPYIGNQPNAGGGSELFFTAQIWNAGTIAGRADEVLYHELVHVLEAQAGGTDGYTDINVIVPPASGSGPPDFKPQFLWHKADFLSVTATNVYSSLLGRKLRHDHDGFREMEQPFRTSAPMFRGQQVTNFGVALARVPTFVGKLAASGAAWNPFVNSVAPVPTIPTIPGGPSPVVPPRPGSLPGVPGGGSPPGVRVETVRLGSQGPTVAWVQSELNRKRFPSPNLGVDGIFGPQTLQAVIAFQRNAKLDPDGVVGPLTRSALGMT